MSSIPDPRVSVDPVVRHGTARLFIGIGESVYTLIPAHGPSPAWILVAHTGQRAGARYTAAINEHGHLSCSCPDHQERGARCKHLGALIGARLLSVPAGNTSPPAAVRHAPAQANAKAITSDPAEISAAQARSRARRAKAVRP